MIHSPHVWQFFRIGGFDQVNLETWGDLAHLNELDQKLWVALSVPSRGLSIDEKTLALIDEDGDGHIRPPELIAAINWAGERIKLKKALVTGLSPLPLDIVDADTHPELLTALKHILAGLDRAEDSQISVEDTCEAVSRFSAQALNGDGIITPSSTENEALSTLINDLSAAYAGPVDRNGSIGVDQSLVERFRTDLTALLEWHQRPLDTPSCIPVKEGSVEAGETLLQVRDKIDDYFARCRLALFDPKAETLVNGNEEQFRLLSLQNLAIPSVEMMNLPLAKVDTNCVLPLNKGINPAWSDAIDAFQHHVVTPLLGKRTVLTEAEWHTLKQAFALYVAWQNERPQNPVNTWEIERLKDLDTGSLLTELEQLIARDQALQPEAEAIAAADQITRYVRDLPRLIQNFVAFRDFYGRRIPGAFQAGTLYIDRRSCELTLEVLDPVKHAALAGLSGTYLIYCECTRGPEKKNIVAAVTAGDTDQLIVGRNGVFYDRQGKDWDATITRIVDHPISLRQAFWSPYRKLSKLISEQIQKFTANKAKASETQLANATTTPTEPAKPAPYDIARSAGIFAAIGLALGALGTALASIITGFLGLKLWQVPLAIGGVMLLISGPSIAMAWFKLRNRSLAMLLDANGWAVNARARINIPFGSSLTQLAHLPPGAHSGRYDPYAQNNPAVPDTET